MLPFASALGGGITGGAGGISMPSSATSGAKGGTQTGPNINIGGTQGLNVQTLALIGGGALVVWLLFK